MFLFNPDLVVGDDEDTEGGDVMGVVLREGVAEGEGQEEEGVDVTHMLAMGAVSSEETVRSEGESSSSQAGEHSALSFCALLEAMYWQH